MPASMPASRHSYDELSTLREMYVNCEAVGENLGLVRLERAFRLASQSAPSIRYEDYPHEVVKREIRVSEAAARLASALHLQWD